MVAEEASQNGVEALTPKQLQLLVFIINRMNNPGQRPPSLDEMKAYMGQKHRSAPRNLVKCLERKGYLRRWGRQWRALEVLKMPVPEKNGAEEADGAKEAAKEAATLSPTGNPTNRDILLLCLKDGSALTGFFIESNSSAITIASWMPDGLTTETSLTEIAWTDVSRVEFLIVGTAFRRRWNL